jgi:hypothetical protein
MKALAVALLGSALALGSMAEPTAASPVVPRPSVSPSAVENVYYTYHGHRYPYRYHGHYYNYRYHGHYYSHRRYVNGHWHYY